MKNDKNKNKDKDIEGKKSFVIQIKEKTAPFFEKIGNLSKLQRILICIATLTIMIGGYYYFFLMPRQDKITSLNKQHNELNSQLATYRKKAALLEEYRKKKKDKEDEFYTALTALPDAKEIPSLLTAVSKSGSDSGLEFLLFKPEAEVKKEFYAEIPVSISVQGGYHQIAIFFDRVSQLSRIVNIKDIDVKYIDNKKTDTTILITSCKAITYRFIEKVEAEKIAEDKKTDKRKNR